MRCLTIVPVVSALVVVSPPASAVRNSGGRCGSDQAGWRAPVEQRYTITSSFGNRTDPINHHRVLHAGIDLAISAGPGPVVAAHGGTVARSGPFGGLGNEVTLRHGDGVQTQYGHMARIDSSIKPGVRIAPGQKLGVEGTTGHSTGNHVHFGVRVHGKPVNPHTFMTRHGAVLNGRPSATGTSTEFSLPAPKNGHHDHGRKPLPVPAKVMDLYVAAGQKYDVPWPLLAGVGMAETSHGKNDHRSSAGARGLMQFIPSTFARYGVDGNHDGKTDITNKADSIYSAAHALHELGVKDGAAGVRTALFHYNHAHRYVNAVLHYAAAYAADSPDDGCTGSVPRSAGTTSPSHGSGAIRWARGQVGHPYRFGAGGPGAWDSSSFVQAAYRTDGVTLPRTAQAQRNWLASGHGTRIRPGKEEPGDLIFEDSYLGPDRIGFVQLVDDDGSQRGVTARNHNRGVARASYARAVHHKHIFEIWRVR